MRSSYRITWWHVVAVAYPLYLIEAALIFAAGTISPCESTGEIRKNCTLANAFNWTLMTEVQRVQIVAITILLPWVSVLVWKIIEALASLIVLVLERIRKR